jgi:biopolymer transport protein TolR
MALVARRTGRRRRLMADINVVPYVDVMLVLVVILMVAAPFVNPSVVNLPSVARAGVQKEIPLRVVVRSDGRISIRESAGQESPVEASQLGAVVRARLSAKPAPVVIEADRAVRYEAVIKTMSELQKAGIERVGLALELAQ